MSGDLRDIEAAHLAKLIRAAQKGDERVLGQIIERTQSRLLKFALLQTGNAQTAEDLCQDTYIKAFGAIGSVKEPEKAISWLYRILKNLAIDRFRLSSNKNETASEDIERMVDPGSGSQGKEEFLYIQELIQSLDEDDRFLILAVHLEGYTYKEAGDLAGLSEDAVRLRLHRARKLLAEKMAKGETNPVRQPSKG